MASGVRGRINDLWGKGSCQLPLMSGVMSTTSVEGIWN